MMSGVKLNFVCVFFSPLLTPLIFSSSILLLLQRCHHGKKNSSIVLMFVSVFFLSRLSRH